MSDPPVSVVYYVCHGMYGCETGCCGYRLCLDDEGDDDDRVANSRFTFSHPGEGQTAEEFARSVWEISEQCEIKPGKWWVC